MKYPALPDEGIDSQVVRQEQAIRYNKSGGVLSGLFATGPGFNHSRLFDARHRT